MTITEKAVCEAYTGLCFCAGDDTWARYAYAERLMGRPVYTHEFAKDDICKALKERAYPDFVRVCKNEPLGFDLEEKESSGSVRLVCVKDKLPEKATVVFNKIPKSCKDCPLCDTLPFGDYGDTEYYCEACMKYMDKDAVGKHLPKDCPIQWLPMFFDGVDENDYDKGYHTGWNHCLASIRGEL